MTRSEQVEITFIRHGRTNWNTAGRLQGRTDVPLNEAGRDDAHRVAKILTAESWHGLYTSPLARAYDTAGVIADQLGLKPQVKQCLIERSYGKLEGKTRRQLRRRRSSRIARRRRVPGMEPDHVLRTRAVHCLKEIVRHHPNERVIVVSHGGFINAFLYRISHARIGTGITQLANGSMTRVIWNKPDTWTVVSINETEHLNRPQGQTDR